MGRALVISLALNLAQAAILAYVYVVVRSFGRVADALMTGAEPRPHSGRG